LFESAKAKSWTIFLLPLYATVDKSWIGESFGEESCDQDHLHANAFSKIIGRKLISSFPRWKATVHPPAITLVDDNDIELELIPEASVVSMQRHHQNLSTMATSILTIMKNASNLLRGADYILRIMTAAFLYRYLRTGNSLVSAKLMMSLNSWKTFPMFPHKRRS
jgi:hypothetical protein